MDREICYVLRTCDQQPLQEAVGCYKLCTFSTSTAGRRDNDYNPAPQLPSPGVQNEELFCHLCCWPGKIGVKDDFVKQRMNGFHQSFHEPDEGESHSRC